MIKITRKGQGKAKKMLKKLISEEKFLAKNPSAKDIKLYKSIKKELEAIAKEGFVSKISFSKSSKAKTKAKKS